MPDVQSLLKSSAWEGVAGVAQQVADPQKLSAISAWLILLRDASREETYGLLLKRGITDLTGHFLSLHTLRSKRGEVRVDSPSRWLVKFPPAATVDLGDGPEPLMRALASLTARTIVQGQVTAELRENPDELFLELLKRALE